MSIVRVMRVILQRLISYDTALIVKVDEEHDFFGPGNFAYHLLVNPLLTQSVAILAHGLTQEVGDFVLGHADLYFVDSCCGKCGHTARRQQC